MEVSKLRMKIGDHEFEAEGPAESVQQQLAAFKELISSCLVVNTPPVANTPEKQDETKENKDVAQQVSAPILDKVMHVSGRIVSLTAIPPSAEDATLLVMLGHKVYRNSDSVTGQEIGDGLAQSGRAVERVDRVMVKPLKEGLVLKSGIRRSTRYRLTNQGHQKALTIAKDLLANLP
jgi:hypothetical protein